MGIRKGMRSHIFWLLWVCLAMTASVESAAAKDVLPTESELEGGVVQLGSDQDNWLKS
jgi:hypothetical protein